MPHFLYIPFKRKALPPQQKELLEHWIALEKANSRDLVLCYQGENSLKNLPANATISVLLMGLPGEYPVLTGAKEIPVAILRASESLSRHLRLYQGNKEQVCLPDLAEHMIRDGLLSNQLKTLDIKLFFFNAGSRAAGLAKSFLSMIMGDERNQSSAIRVQYHHNASSRSFPMFAQESLKTKAKEKGTKQEKQASMTQASVFLSGSAAHASLYNKKEAQPRLSADAIKRVIAHYNSYKSARVFGLSGILGLNGLFSSDVSADMKKFLLTSTDEYLSYSRAFLFVRRYPENQLAKYLKDALRSSVLENLDDWNKLHSPVQSSPQPQI